MSDERVWPPFDEDEKLDCAAMGFKRLCCPSLMTWQGEDGEFNLANCCAISQPAYCGIVCPCSPCYWIPMLHYRFCWTGFGEVSPQPHWLNKEQYPSDYSLRELYDMDALSGAESISKVNPVNAFDQLPCVLTTMLCHRSCGIGSNVFTRSLALSICLPCFFISGAFFLFWDLLCFFLCCCFCIPCCVSGFVRKYVTDYTAGLGS